MNRLTNESRLALASGVNQMLQIINHANFSKAPKIIFMVWKFPDIHNFEAKNKANFHEQPDLDSEKRSVSFELLIDISEIRLSSI